mgnify:CR=1 FL=1
MAHDILLIEDDLDILEFTRLVLTNHGYAVRSALDGREALEAVGERLPDLILLDLMMPIMDGFAVGKTLRADERTRDIPIVVFSAYPGGLARAREINPDGYLTKPFELEDLLSCVELCIRPRWGSRADSAGPS